MNRRDYELVAKILRRAKSIAGERDVEAGFMDNIISDFCSAIKQENHTFNEVKFRLSISGKENKNVETNQENV